MTPALSVSARAPRPDADHFALAYAHWLALDARRPLGQEADALLADAFRRDDLPAIGRILAGFEAQA